MINQAPEKLNIEQGDINKSSKGTKEYVPFSPDTLPKKEKPITPEELAKKIEGLTPHEKETPKTIHTQEAIQGKPTKKNVGFTQTAEERRKTHPGEANEKRIQEAEKIPQGIQEKQGKWNMGGRATQWIIKKILGTNNL